MGLEFTQIKTKNCQITLTRSSGFGSILKIKESENNITIKDKNNLVSLEIFKSKYQSLISRAFKENFNKDH